MVADSGSCNSNSYDFPDSPRDVRRDVIAAAGLILGTVAFLTIGYYFSRNPFKNESKSETHMASASPLEISVK